MPRLNVYLPDDLMPLVDRWRDRVNLSEVCTAALRDSLLALESGRAIGPLLQQLFGAPTDLEAKLAERFNLRRAIVGSMSHGEDERDVIARRTASFLDRTLFDGVTLAVGGGRQMWSVVRNASARALRVRLCAVGIGQVDPRVLHAHPNTLVTLLWLLFSPRATASLVGSNEFGSLWRATEPVSEQLSRVMIGSCADFSAQSPFADLLGVSNASDLCSQGVRADFLGVFLTENGETVNAPDFASSSLPTAGSLRANSLRSDTLIVLAAGGPTKIRAMQLTLSAGLCNSVVTDENTALALLQ